MNVLRRVLYVIRWILGILLVLIGITNFAHPAAAIFSFLIAGIAIPPIYNFAQRRSGRTIPKPVTAIAVLVLLAGLVVATPTENHPANPNELNNFVEPTTQSEPENIDGSTELLEPETEQSEQQRENNEPEHEEETNPAPVPAALPVSQPSQPKQETPKVVSQPKSNCDPNYSGCVPIASDVDCAGGSGDGPAYVSGPITVIGSDIYGLDRDKDGIACE